MGKKTGILAAVLLVVVIISAMVWIFPYGEGPSYNGKHLSAWLRELPGKGSTARGICLGPIFTNYSRSELTAVEAVQHIGTNALPFLMEEMHTQKLGAMEEVGFFWKEQRENLMHLILRKPIAPPSSRGYRSYAELRHWDAARGLHALGSQGQSAIPELVKLLNVRETSPDAAYALAGMGTNGSAVLLEYLYGYYGYDWSCMCAAWALGQTRTNTEAVIPLVKLLKNKDAVLRTCAIWSLGQIGAEPELVAPALAENLGDTGINARFLTEQAHSEYGVKSVSARTLVDYLNDPKLHVRMAATNALRVLYPQEAANAGIQ